MSSSPESQGGDEARRFKQKKEKVKRVASGDGPGRNKQTKTQIESIDYSSGIQALQQSDTDRCRSNNAITAPTDL